MTCGLLIKRWMFYFYMWVGRLRSAWADRILRQHPVTTRNTWVTLQSPAALPSSLGRAQTQKMCSKTFALSSFRKKCVYFCALFVRVDGENIIGSLCWNLKLVTRSSRAPLMKTSQLPQCLKELHPSILVLAERLGGEVSQALPTPPIKEY